MYVLSISSVSEVLMVLMTLAMLARSLYLLSESGYETPANNLPHSILCIYTTVLNGSNRCTSRKISSSADQYVVVWCISSQS